MGKKIMCVDDSSTMRILIKETVLKHGYTITEAGNGQQALDALSPDIDLFLVDVNMPVMDGFTFVENLKKIPAYSNKPVVFLTTESTADKKARGRELGVSGWIIKPFQPESFLKVIDMLSSV